MKWTEDQIKGLKQLCMKGVSNKELAAHFQVPITEIHAKRSALGITIPKVKAMQEGKVVHCDCGDNEKSPCQTAI